MLVFVLILVVLWLSAQVGDLIRKTFLPFQETERGDFTVVVSAMLTLLGLLIGFAFSMAVTRYDQRKNYQEAEANAIGICPCTPSARPKRCSCSRVIEEIC